MAPGKQLPNPPPTSEAVSRSMQGQDVSPDRLTRAKEYIRDMMEEMGGDRVGLIIFAGKTKLIVPLTSNYSDVNIALDEVSTQIKDWWRLGNFSETSGIICIIPRHYADLFCGDVVPENIQIYFVADVRKAFDNLLAETSSA